MLTSSSESAILAPFSLALRMAARTISLCSSVIIVGVSGGVIPVAAGAREAYELDSD